MTTTVFLFFIACVLIPAGNLALVLSVWHRDGVVGKLTKMAVAVIAAVPALTLAFSPEHVDRYIGMDPFAHWLVIALAANVTWRVARTLLDRRAILRQQPRFDPQSARIVRIDE